jgi:hypothetical protein
MSRVLPYVVVFPFLMGLPFLGLASTSSFGHYIVFVYKVMIVPALLLAAIDFLLSRNERAQGVACAVGGAAGAILSVTIWLGAVHGPVYMALGFMGALAGTLCWMAARCATTMEATETTAS